MFDRIGLITNNKGATAKGTLDTITDYLLKKEKTIVVNPCCAQLLNNSAIKTVANDQIAAHCDLAIAIGGDGTMLMASHFLYSNGVPLLGINLGKLGFLSDIPANKITGKLDQILAGDYIEDRRFLLQANVFRDGDCILTAAAFNDVVIQKWNIARLVALDTYIDSVFVHTHRSDGLIVATPTGSTAYALSGGGPILYPTLEVLVLVPICPHTLGNRPIVIASESKIEVIVGTRANDQARLTCDGEIKLELMPGDRVCINKKDKEIRLIHPPTHDQFQVLREKLHWSR